MKNLYNDRIIFFKIIFLFIMSSLISSCNLNKNDKIIILKNNNDNILYILGERHHKKSFFHMNNIEDYEFLKGVDAFMIESSSQYNKNDLKLQDNFEEKIKETVKNKLIDDLSNHKLDAAFDFDINILNRLKNLYAYYYVETYYLKKYVPEIKMMKILQDSSYVIEKYAENGNKKIFYIDNIEKYEKNNCITNELLNEMIISLIENIENKEFLDVILDEKSTYLKESELTNLFEKTGSNSKYKNLSIIYDCFVKPRNYLWLNDIISIANKNQKSLLIVGALHLPGPEGLIELLKKEGFTMVQK